jgi:hypothetical protein
VSGISIKLLRPFCVAVAVAAALYVAVTQSGILVSTPIKTAVGFIGIATALVVEFVIGAWKRPSRAGGTTGESSATPTKSNGSER